LFCSPLIANKLAPIASASRRCSFDCTASPAACWIVVARDENENDNFRKSFSSFFFRFSGLNENENDKINQKRKRKRFCSLPIVFEDLPYLVGNLPLVGTDSKYFRSS
jgi:hypothetical protein